MSDTSPSFAPLTVTISLRAASPFALSLQAMTTLAPILARPTAAALPMPEFAPVIRHVLPATHSERRASEFSNDILFSPLSLAASSVVDLRLILLLCMVRCLRPPGHILEATLTHSALEGVVRGVGFEPTNP